MFGYIIKTIKQFRSSITLNILKILVIIDTRLKVESTGVRFLIRSLVIEPVIAFRVVEPDF